MILKTLINLFKRSIANINLIHIASIKQKITIPECYDNQHTHLHKPANIAESPLFQPSTQGR
jgi:hypothetical protein